MPFLSIRHHNSPPPSIITRHLAISCHSVPAGQSGFCIGGIGCATSLSGTSTGVQPAATRMATTAINQRAMWRVSSFALRSDSRSAGTTLATSMLSPCTNGMCVSRRKDWQRTVLQVQPGFTTTLLMLNVRDCHNMTIYLTPHAHSLGELSALLPASRARVVGSRSMVAISLPSL